MNSAMARAQSFVKETSFEKLPLCPKLAFLEKKFSVHFLFLMIYLFALALVAETNICRLPCHVTEIHGKKKIELEPYGAISKRK